MNLALLIGIVVGASLLLAAGGVRLLRLPPGRVRVAGGAVLEFAGLWTLCLVTDLALGAAAVVLLRHVAGVFVSVYVLNDLVLVVLSALQAAGLWGWLAAARPS